jgi:hypothetical protein
MNQRKLLLISGLLLTLAPQRAWADDVRYYADNGITYRETTQVVKRAIPHTEMQQRDVTYYRERVTTDLQEVTRTYQVPVTQYQYEPYLEGRWNPFVQPNMTYRMVPRTRWETKSETVKIPVARREVVPEKLTQQVPVTTHKIAEDRVVTRVAVGTTSTLAPGGALVGTGAGGSGVAGQNSTGAYGMPPGTLPAGSGDPIGGVSKIDPNQPKQNPDWRASDALLRR